MNNTIKKIVYVATSLALVGSITGCSKKEDAKTEKSEKTYAYTVQTLDNPYFATLSEGFKEACDKEGIKSIISNGEQDPAKQISQIENFINQKVDAIVISPTDDKALEAVVQEAKDAGITVISCNQEVKGTDAFITVPEYEYGETIGKVAADWINEKFDKKVDVLVLDYPEIESIIARGDGIRDALKKAPNANIVNSISANTPEKGSRAMETTLQQYPDVKVVVGVNDAGVLGAYEVVMAANKATDDFFMGGLDSTDKALALISQGTIYRATVDINPKGTGKLILDTIKKVEEEGKQENPISIDMIPVTEENVSEFIEK